MNHSHAKPNSAFVGKATSRTQRFGYAFSDTFVVLTYYTLVGGVDEYVEAVFNAKEVTFPRLAALPIISATGTIYGGWRDIVRKATQFETTRQVAKLLIETAFCSVFRVLVYALILKFGGAEGDMLCG